MRMFLNLQKMDNVFQIVGTQTIEENPKMPNELLVEIFDTKVFLFVAEMIVQKRVLTLPLEFKDITLDNIIASENNTERDTYLFHAREIMAQTLTKIPMYFYFRFVYLNNIFASKGIFITQENREEKYIEILEKNDDQLTKYFEEYLSVLNELESTEQMYSHFLSCEEVIKNTNDVRDMIDAVKDLKDYFTFNNSRIMNKDRKFTLSTTGELKEKLRLDSSN